MVSVDARVNSVHFGLRTLPTSPRVIFAVRLFVTEALCERVMLDLQIFHLNSHKELSRTRRITPTSYQSILIGSDREELRVRKLECAVVVPALIEKVLHVGAGEVIDVRMAMIQSQHVDAHLVCNAHSLYGWL